MYRECYTDGTEEKEEELEAYRMSWSENLKGRERLTDVCVYVKIISTSE
jgi:hypothetical protein